MAPLAAQGGIGGNQFFPATGVNTYTVTYSYTDSLGCSNSVFQSVSVLLCSGIPENDRIQQIKIYPNPNTGTFTLSMVSADKHLSASVYVYNMMGEVIFKKEKFNEHLQIDISGNSQGLYFVKVMKGGEMFLDKIIYQ